MLIFEVLVVAVDVAPTTIDSFICGGVCPAAQPGAVAQGMSPFVMLSLILTCDRGSMLSIISHHTLCGETFSSRKQKVKPAMKPSMLLERLKCIFITLTHM